jgi:hypothetical protein
VGVGALLGDVKPPGLDICGGVDCLGTSVIEFCTEHIAFMRICFLYVGIIIMCMCVSLVLLPFKTVMGWIPTLECMLLGACGFLQLCRILSGSECYRPQGPDMDHAYPFSRSPRVG